MERLTSNAPACFSGRQLQHAPRPAVFTSRPAKLQKRTVCAAYEGTLIHSRFPGFSEDDAEPLQELVQQKTLVTPESASWGLSVAQMRAMGITSESERQSNIDPVSVLQMLYPSPSTVFYMPGNCLRMGIQEHEMFSSCEAT